MKEDIIQPAYHSQCDEATAINTDEARDGIRVLPSRKRMPDAKGVLAQVRIDHPQPDKICHFAAFQRHDPGGKCHQHDSIGGGANRMQGLRVDAWSQAIEGGMLAILQLENKEWLALLPISGPETIAWLAPRQDTLFVNAGTLGTDPVDSGIPLLVWSRSDNVYSACENVWKEALRHPLMRGMGRLRNEKVYPEIFKYLGWCSWEQYKRDISSDKLADAAHRINESELPIRFVLVDDGYLCHSDNNDGKENQLLRLGANAEKFPNAWTSLLSQRTTRGIRWFGLWQNFNGYWNCIAPDNQLGTVLNSHLMELPSGGLLPKATLPAATGWYEAMLSVACHAGFDFVKVDNQAENLKHYTDTGNAAKAAACSNQALERAAAAQVDGLINCMAHGPVNTFNTCLSAVTRCSEDYVVHNAWRAKAHLHNSYQNMLWLAPTVWGDHDMFHSSDSFAGRMMAVSKAMSGAPVYLSDDPGDFKPEVVWPLCDDSGRLFRPLAPAVPLPDSVMIDPFEDGYPYMVGAPLPNQSAALVVYNLTEPTRPVRGHILPEHYTQTTGVPHNKIAPGPEPTAGLLLYDWYNGQATELQDNWEYHLETFEDRLLLLCPIRNDWAVIGRADKYLSPAGIELIETSPEQVLLRTPGPADITLWHKGKLHTVKVTKGLNRVTPSQFEMS